MKSLKETIDLGGHGSPAMDYYISMNEASGDPSNIEGLFDAVSEILGIEDKQDLNLSWERCYSGVYGIIVKYHDEEEVMYLTQDEISKFKHIHPYFKNDYTDQAKKAISTKGTNILILNKTGVNEFTNYIKGLFPNFPDLQVSLTGKERTEVNVSHFNSNIELGFNLNRKDLDLNCVVVVVDENVDNYKDENEYQKSLEFANKNADIIIFK